MAVSNSGWLKVHFPLQGFFRICGWVWTVEAFGKTRSILGATATVANSSYIQSIITGKAGFFEMELPYGTYTLSFSAPGHKTETSEIVVTSNSVTTYRGVVLEPEMASALKSTTSCVVVTTVTATIENMLMRVSSDSSTDALIFDSANGICSFSVRESWLLQCHRSEDASLRWAGSVDRWDGASRNCS